MLYDYFKTRWTAPSPEILVTDPYQAVRKANAAEFEVYKSLPTLDLSHLDDYFIKDAPAYTTIANTAHRSVERKRVLTNPNNPSTHEIYSIKLVELRQNEAIVETEEYWYLRWFEPLKNDYSEKVYKEINNQFYVLRWYQGRWKVYSNAYPPRTDNSALPE